MKVNHIGARQEAIVKTNGSNRSTRYLILRPVPVPNVPVVQPLRSVHHGDRPVPVVQKFNRYASLKPLQAITTWRGLTRFENYQNVKTFSGVERLYTWEVHCAGMAAGRKINEPLVRWAVED